MILNLELIISPNAFDHICVLDDFRINDHKKDFKISIYFTKNLEKIARAAPPRVCVMLARIANKSVMKVLFDRETQSIAVLEALKLLLGLFFRLYSKSCKKCF